MTYPKISVVIPLYNKEHYVKASVQSVLNQTYRNIEIIVVDDGSSDNSYNIVKSIKTPNLTIFRQKNLGVSAARNKGIKYATGEFIAFLDADDFWHNNFISSFINDLCKEPSVKFWSSGYQFFDKGTLRQAKFHISSQPEEPGFINYYQFSLIDPIVTSSSVIIHSSIFRNHLYFDEFDGLGEDLMMWVKIVEKEQLYFNPNLLSYYRYEYINNSSRLNKKNPKMLSILRYLPDALAVQNNADALEYYYLYLRKNIRREAFEGHIIFSIKLLIRGLYAVFSKSKFGYVLFYLLKEVSAIFALYIFGIFGKK